MLLIDTTFLAFGRTGIGTVINQLLDVFDKEKIEYQKISYFDYYKQKDRKSWYYYFNNILLNEIEKLTSDDIFLFPENLGGILRFKKFKCKTIFIILDLFEMRSKNKLLYLLKKARFRNVLNKVEIIMTISNYCKDDIVKNFPSFSKKIYVFYPFYIDDEDDNTIDEKSLERLENTEKYLSQQFILANGSGQERKNAEFLLKYANQIYNDFGLKIILFGKDFHGNSYANINNYIKRYNCADKVVHLGAVSDNRLRVLYKQSACFVFPSLDEGFGLPPVEALQNDCRIAVSNISIFKEVLYPLDRYFDFTYESFSENLKKVLQISDSEFLKEKDTILEKFRYENYKKTLFSILF